MQLPRHLDDDSYAALKAFLSVHPDAGDVMRCWLAKKDHVYLITLYATGVKDDLTVAERAAWHRAVQAIDDD